ncbi:MAG TPA: hypothetical protein VIP11_14325 [Gemmatimonadaceae bacterium]
MRLPPLVAALSIVAACSSASSPSAAVDGVLALGQWGGDSAAMIVSDTAVHLHIACTYGDVSGRISVRANGDFDVSGRYLLRAFPVAVGPTMPARITGHLDGRTALLTVTVDDTVQKQTIVRGPVRVELGRDARLMPCPICRRPILTR